jgi:hypothetical protein
MRTIDKEIIKAKKRYSNSELIEWRIHCKKHGDDCYSCTLRCKCAKYGGLIIPEFDFKKIKLKDKQ